MIPIMENLSIDYDKTVGMLISGSSGAGKSFFDLSVRNFE